METSAHGCQARAQSCLWSLCSYTRITCPTPFGWVFFVCFFGEIQLHHTVSHHILSVYYTPGGGQPPNLTQQHIHMDTHTYPTLSTPGKL